MTTHSGSGPVPRPVSIRFWLLTVALVFVQAAWMAYAVLSSFEIQLNDGVGEPLSFWLLWELASIVVTIVVTIAFWVSCFMREDGHSIFEGSSVRYGVFGAVLLFVFAVGFLTAGWCAWSKMNLTLQAWMLVVGVLGTIGLELLAMASTFNALEKRQDELSVDRLPKARRSKIAEEVRTILGNRDNVAKYLCFSDIPIAFAILSLALMVTFQGSVGARYDEGQMRSFIAGAVAVQLLYSNFVFWLEALADYPGGDAFLDSLPNWLKSIRQMLQAARHLPKNATPEWAIVVLGELFPKFIPKNSSRRSRSSTPPNNTSSPRRMLPPETNKET